MLTFLFFEVLSPRVFWQAAELLGVADGLVDLFGCNKGDRIELFLAEVLTDAKLSA